MILLGEPFAVVAELAPERDRGRYLAAYGVCWGVATTVGPAPGDRSRRRGWSPLLWLSCAALCAGCPWHRAPSESAVTRK